MYRILKATNNSQPSARHEMPRCRRTISSAAAFWSSASPHGCKSSLLRILSKITPALWTEISPTTVAEVQKPGPIVSRRISWKKRSLGCFSSQ